MHETSYGLIASESCNSRKSELVLLENLGKTDITHILAKVYNTPLASTHFNTTGRMNTSLKAYA